MRINFKNINRTKIVATIGPKSANVETIRKMALAGLNVARINMSHGDLEYFEKVANAIRIVNQDPLYDFNISIMTDTKGPEIRVGKLNKPLKIEKDSIVTIYTKCFKTPNKKNTFYVYDSTKKYNMAKDVKVGNKILVDDGKLHLIVKSVNVNKGIITATALNSHSIVTNKRINLPNSHYTMPFLSDTDKANLLDTIKIGADSIALSFVNCAKDVMDVRNFLEKAKKDNGIQLFAKIETQQSLDNIKEIIKVSDGVMIARGDLGLETPYFDIPKHEIEIIELCKKANKPVIVATQMLDSLEFELQPTRAEVTDVFFACLCGADSTMLSGETASGLYPVESVQTMATINKASEDSFDCKKHFKDVFLASKFPLPVKRQVGNILLNLNKNKSKAFVINTNDERLIKAISIAKLPALAIVVTSNEKLVKKFGVNYGIKMHYDSKPDMVKKVMYL